MTNCCPVPQTIAYSFIVVRQIRFRNKIPKVGVMRRPVLIMSFGDGWFEINSRKPSPFEVAVWKTNGDRRDAASILDSGRRPPHVSWMRGVRRSSPSSINPPRIAPQRLGCSRPLVRCATNRGPSKWLVWRAGNSTAVFNAAFATTCESGSTRMKGRSASNP